MAGAASGLLVGTQVGSSIDALTSQAFLLVMMIGGAIGFYLGIDTPPLAFHAPNAETDQKVDSAEFLTAVGTFLATSAAFASIAAIAFREDPHVSWNVLILAGWIVGLVMQIVAGTIARARA
jgi:hypothetical protein